MIILEFITTGNEIMSGLTVDTNFSWAADQINKTGHNVKYHTSISDNMDDIKSALKTAALRSDYIIFTGGLGPTEDDLTSEAVSEFFNAPLVFNEQSYGEIVNKLEKRGRKVLDIHRKQAMFPEGSEIINNEVGTSSGFKFVSGESSFYFLPGVPREFKSMISGFVLPDILREKSSDISVLERVIKTVGLGESEVATKISGLALDGVELSYRIFYPEIHLKLTSINESTDKAGELIEEYTNLLKEKLGRFIFTTDNEQLEEVVSGLLKENNLTVSTAESCTGGLLSSRLTDIPGSSSYFLRGVVSYSNESKTDLLNVPEKLILEHGAVSAEVVESMAHGIRDVGGTDIGVAVSGIAGPGGGSDEKPVGTVYIGIDFMGEEVVSEKFYFNGTRKDIKLISTEYALDMIRKKILNKFY